MATKDVARPEAQQDQLEAIQHLTDLANDQARQGLTHSGRLVTVTLDTTNTEVAHLLGRVPAFVFPVLLGAAATVYVDTPHGDPRNYVNVRASVAVTATLLIA
jgi:hypothetical protein